MIHPTVLLTAFILCPGQAAPTKVYVEVQNRKEVASTVYLLKQGYYNYVTGDRCRATKVTYTDKETSDNAAE